MKRALLTRTASLAALAAIAAVVAVSSCGKKIIPSSIQNLLPQVTITAAPIDTTIECDPSPTRSCYLITVDWVGYDADGRVDHYLYAVDPPSAPNSDTLWKTTTSSEVLVTFNADKKIVSTPDDARQISEAPHVFALKAVDNSGAAGPVVSRGFFSFTEAPTVQITDPTPNFFLTPVFPPSVRISWSGQDPDGVFHTKPVRYKYILLGPSSTFTPAAAAQAPDSLRNHYAPNFDGWIGVGGDTTEIQLTNLTPNHDYMFVLVGFDEAGAYSPIFNLNTNMFRFHVGFAGQNGPKITMFNEFFDYTYKTGTYCPCPQTEVHIEVPAGIRITFNWSAEPSPGANIRSYRWSLDNPDVSVEDPRTDESQDLSHWSTRALSVTSATVGPFPGGTSHRFYIEAEDNNGLRSLGIVNFMPVQSTLERSLLIVNDTRLKVDGLLNGQDCVQAPRGPWPTVAELDTFLFAAGGAPWKCYPTGTRSAPGLFLDYGVPGSPDVPNSAGYDTLGTRNGKVNQSVPLLTLGKYAHVIWIVDGVGANLYLPGTDPQAETALRYMTSTGTFNTLAAYVKQGGRVWLTGGGSGFASSIEHNDPTNDQPTIKFASTGRNRELGPGRLMYDVAGWQSEFRCSPEPVELRRFTGRFGDAGAVSGAGSPYADLPPILEKKTRQSDPLPPSRASSDFYQTVTRLEYLEVENFVIQAVQHGTTTTEESVLDTLYEAPYGGSLPGPADNAHNVVMTCFHGPSVPQGVIFSGFSIWYWKRSECKALVDFVLQRMWSIPASGGVASR